MQRKILLLFTFCSICCTIGQCDVNRAINSRNPHRANFQPSSDTYHYNDHPIPIEIGNSAPVIPFSSSSSSPASSQSSLTKQLNRVPFSTKLFQILSQWAFQENLVFSPISLKALLSFVYTVSKGKLSQELRSILNVPLNTTRVAWNFENLLNSFENSHGIRLVMANNLYYGKQYGPLADEIEDLAHSSFGLDLNRLDFSMNYQAANVINSWVAKKTERLIQNIVSGSSFNAETKAVLINAIYFKGEWEIEFSEDDTKKQQFYKLNEQEILVDMMCAEDIFRYGHFDELKASVLELPYKGSDIRMLILLPDQRDGLRDLEQKLHQVNLHNLTEQLKREEVTVQLPKFSIEYSHNMIKPLQQMGLVSLFNEDSEMNIFKDQRTPLFVDQIQHKAFIRVNEAGTEAAASSFLKITPLSLPVRMIHFAADHPFVFVIINSNVIFFMGHVVEP
uniref:Serpin domain-containing protein n=1 Tax=Glossina pallidipes TaxID=7398 RepID=A0A1B0AAT5_GLOPL